MEGVSTKSVVISENMSDLPKEMWVWSQAQEKQVPKEKGVSFNKFKITGLRTTTVATNHTKTPVKK